MPRVSAITILGASGSRWSSSLRRARVAIRRSSSATPAAKRRASPIAVSSTREDGAAVS